MIRPQMPLAPICTKGLKASVINLILFGILTSCAKPDASAEETTLTPDDQETQNSCPVEKVTQGLPPNTDEVHHDLYYWIETWAGSFDLDEVLLTPTEIEAHRTALTLEQVPEGVEGTLKSQIDLNRPFDQATLEEKINGRLTYLKKMLDEGTLVTWNGDALNAEESGSFQPEAHQIAPPKTYIALEEFQIRCGPYPRALKRLDADQTIDRNACTRVKPQTPIQILAHSPQGMRLIRSRLAIGWIGEEVKLSAKLTDKQVQDYLGEHFIYASTVKSEKSDLFRAQMKQQSAMLSPLGGTRFPLVSTELITGEEQPPPSIWVAGSDAVKVSTLSELGIDQNTLSSAQRPLTRRSFLNTLFTMIDQSYGLGGAQGGVDCSRLIVNALEPFGLNPPRYSGHQAHMGTFSVDISQVNNERERLNLLNAALKRGITLLYFPGHITVYLGADQEGVPRLLHAFADYQEVCDNREGESKLRVNRVAVTDIYRGQGSTKGSYLSRGTRIVVLGGSPGPALAGLTHMRLSAPIVKPERKACRRIKNRARIFTSPRAPHRGQDTRLMVTRPSDDSPASLTLFGSNDQIIVPKLTRLGGPPYTYYSEPLTLSEGMWRAVYGEGKDLHSCTHIEVKRKPSVPPLDENIWTPEEEWSPHTETLFSAFVERLFQYPIEEDRSWTNLQDVLNVTDKNILFNHFSQDEEAQLKLKPDCADLPYTLRAYFAWKMRLPFSYMTCTRGNKRKAPQCMDRTDSLLPRQGKTLGNDFQWFARKGVAGHVHSASARTLPQDQETELYPVALNRETLRPGIVFADPYGHILLIAGWEKQPLNGYGILIGADGQPDGTIGRRRFWEGSFLFDPDTKVVGAGFKAFRPLVKIKSPKRLKKTVKQDQSEIESPHLWRPLNNEELTPSKMGALAWSDQQYRGSRLDFYDVMNGLSSPRPVEIKAQLNALADALFESARRRVLSVNNGEDWIKKHRKRRMKMPRGYAIFQTAGPWEDFATPSRDMRLLIAIDTVLDLPKALRRNPQRFGMTAKEVEDALSELKATLERALRSRSFDYTKSDGTNHTLTLWDLTQRQSAFEVAYNPNDCVEIRWGAPKDSQEYKTCKRHAPRSQLRKMKKYRTWFNERKRPPRGTR